MKKGMSLLLTFVLILAVLMPLSAKQKQMQKGEGMECRMEMKIPDITEEQMKKMDDINMKFKKDMIDMQADMKKKMLELGEIVRKEANEKKALSKIDEIAKIKTNIQKERIKKHFRIRELLNDEQKKMFDMNFMKMGKMGENMPPMDKKIHQKK